MLSSLDLIIVADKQSYAVGAFNVILLEHAESIINAAESSGLSTILQISENAIKYHGSLKPIVIATVELASKSSIPVSVHLDHIEDVNLIKEGLDLGVDSVMFDGSKLDFQENIETSLKMSELAHSYNASIEVELGEIGGKDGVHAPGVRTNPAEAKKFVEETGVDLLAVAVGSSHAMTTREAKLDFELIASIHKAVDVPLVLHGSSGVNDEDLQRAVRAGMRKINISTHLNQLFTQAIARYMSENPKTVDPRKYIGYARDLMSDEVARLLRLLALKN